MQSSKEISSQLIQVVEELPSNRQAEILDFALFLRERELHRKWDEIPDEEAAALRDEFREEDIRLAEGALRGYREILQREDRA